MKPKELLKVAKSKFPHAKKKELVRAASFAVIASSDKAEALHNMATTVHGGED